MSADSTTSNRHLCVDPGEETGWSIWKGSRLLGGGQTPLWPFAHDVWDALNGLPSPLEDGGQDWLHKSIEPEENTGPISLIVCEKFNIYPWAAKELAWDELRTVQLIGALFFMSTLLGVEFHKQPASIKERAMAGGAKELFVRPLHENRHQNDSIMHGFFYWQVEKQGLNLGIPDGAPA